MFKKANKENVNISYFCRKEQIELLSGGKKKEKEKVINAGGGRTNQQLNCRWIQFKVMNHPVRKKVVNRYGRELVKTD